MNALRFLFAMMLLATFAFAIGPTAPTIITPTIGSIGLMNISYQQSNSTDNKTILYYNISLMNSGGTFNKTIIANNSLNLTYQFNVSSTNFGAYFVRVTAYDNASQTASANSSVLSIGNSTITKSTTLVSSVSDYGSPSLYNFVLPSNIVFDCAGYSIVGTGLAASYGIFPSSAVNTTVKNCNISNMSSGLYIYLGSGIVADNITTTTTGAGVTFYNHANGSLSNSYLNSTGGHSLTIQGSINTTITNTSAYNTGAITSPRYGAYIVGGSNNTRLINVSAGSIDQSAIYITGTKNVLVDCLGTLMTGKNAATAYGVYSDSFNTTVQNCNFLNFTTAIQFTGSTNSTLTNDNVTTTLTGPGIYIYGANLAGGSTYATLSNIVSNTTIGGYAIYVRNSQFAKLTNITAYSGLNGRVLEFDTSHGSTLTNAYLMGSGNGNAKALFADSSNLTLTNVTGIITTGSGSAIELNGVPRLNNTLINSFGNASTGTAIVVATANSQVINSSGTSSGTIFSLSGNNSVIDCSGLPLITSTATGMAMLAGTNLTIKNCNVTATTTSTLLVQGSINSTVSNSTFTNNATGGYAIRVNGVATGNTFTGITATQLNTNPAVRIEAMSSGNTINNATFSAPTYTLYITNSTNTIVSNSSVNKTSNAAAIYPVSIMVNSHGTQIINTSVWSNATSGIYIDSGSNVTIDCKGSAIIGTNTAGTSGVRTTQFNTTVRNCNISGFATGINYTAGASNGTVDGGTFSNLTTGIYMTDVSYMMIANSSTNASSPLYLFDVNSSTIRNNTFVSANGTTDLVMLLNSTANTLLLNNFTATAGMYVNATYVPANGSATKYCTQDLPTVASVPTNCGAYTDGSYNLAPDEGDFTNYYVNPPDNENYWESGGDATVDRNVFTSDENNGGDSYLELAYNVPNSTVVSVNMEFYSAEVDEWYGATVPAACYANTTYMAVLVDDVNDIGYSVYCLNVSADRWTWFFDNPTGTPWFAEQHVVWGVATGYVPQFTNYFNGTYAGKNQGNVWANVMNGSVEVYGALASSIPGLSIGSTGSGVPYTQASSKSKLNGYSTDYAPLTDACGCMDLTAVNGVCTLKSNQITTSTCFTAKVTNVTVDCNGYSILGNSSTSATYGIYSDQQYTSVRNCYFANLSQAINLNGAYYANITNTTMNLTGNAYTFRAGNTYSGSLTNSRVYTNTGNAVDLDGAQLFKITNVNVTANSTGQGIILSSAYSNNLTNVIVNTSTGKGISLSVSHYNLIDRSRVTNTNRAIYLLSSDGNTISNTVANGGIEGIMLESWSDNNLISNSTGTATAGAGIFLAWESFNNTVINSVGNATGTGSMGIYLEAGTNTDTLINTTGQGDSGQGILFKAASGNTLTNCRAISNSSNGMYFDGGLMIGLGVLAENNTIANTTISSTTGIPLGMTTNSSKNKFYNNTLISGNGASLLLNISASSDNNTFCLNNFTDTAAAYVNDLGMNNTYNCTYSGLNQGNAWANVIAGSVGAHGLNNSSVAGLYIGTIGPAVPYNSTTSEGKFICPAVGCADYAPLTPTQPLSYNCGDLWEEGFVYQMTRNLTANGQCFVIDGAAITLDCNGYSIFGRNLTGEFGVQSGYYDNTKVINCHIYDFGGGMYIHDGSYAELRNNTIGNSVDYGELLENLYTSNITDTTISSNDIGIYGSVLADSKIDNVNVSAANKGMILEGGYANTMTRMNLTASNDAGLIADGMETTTLANSVIAGPGSQGALETYGGCSDWTIANNTIDALGGKYGYTYGDGATNTGNLVINNTFVNADMMLLLTDGTTSNTYCLNNFTDTTGNYIIDKAGGNTYDCIYDGKDQGNVYANVVDGTVSITGYIASSIAGLYIGNAGAVPYDESNSDGKIGGVASDIAPLTPFYLSPIDFIVTPPTAHDIYRMGFLPATCVWPTNQTNATGIYTLSNTATDPLNVTIRLNATTYGMIFTVSNSSNLSTGLNLTTSPQVIYHDIAGGDSRYLWACMSANESLVSPPKIQLIVEAE